MTQTASLHAWRSWTPLALWTLPALILNLLVANLLRDDHSRISDGIVLGSMLGQLSLVAIWIGLGPVSFLKRVMQGLSAIAILLLASAVFYLRQNASAEFLLLFSVTGLAVVVILVASLMIVRCLGCKLAWTDENALADRSPPQLKLIHLFGWIACLCLVLCLCRFVIHQLSFRNDLLPVEVLQMSYLILVLTTFQCASLAPLLLTSFATRHIWLWFTLAFVACYLIMQAELITLTLSGRGTPPDSKPIQWINAMQFAIVAVGLLGLRLCGLQLRRR